MSQSREANMEKICSLFLLIPGSLTLHVAHFG